MQPSHVKTLLLSLLAACQGEPEPQGYGRSSDPPPLREDTGDPLAPHDPRAYILVNRYAGPIEIWVRSEAEDPPRAPCRGEIVVVARSGTQLGGEGECTFPEPFAGLAGLRIDDLAGEAAAGDVVAGELTALGSRVSWGGRVVWISSSPRIEAEFSGEGEGGLSFEGGFEAY